MQRRRDAGILSSKWTVSIKIPQPRVQGTLQRRIQEECRRQIEWKTPRHKILQTIEKQHTYKLIQTGVACTGPTRVQTRWVPRLRRVVNTSCYLYPRTYFCLINSCKCKFSLHQKTITVSQTLLKDGPHAHKNELNDVFGGSLFENVLSQHLF